MAKRRAAASGSANAGSNVYVNFEGLAELLHGSVPRPPSMAHSAHLESESPRKRRIDVTKWPKTSLAAFCEDYNISNQLQDKLIKLYIQGPHALCWISDEDLRREGGLALGELGTLRDAEQRWKNCCMNPMW
jgi:hypothetical protein